MGTPIGPSYACFFVGYLEETIFKSYREPTHDLYKRFIDITGASSLPQEHLEQFIQYIQSFHPAIEYTYNITHKKLSFLGTEMTPTDDDTISTSVYYKETDHTTFSDTTLPIPPHAKINLDIQSSNIRIIAQM